MSPLPRRTRALYGMTAGLWFTAPTLLVAQTLLPAEIAKVLTERGDLTFAAVFVAGLAVGATVYVSRLLFVALERNRADYRESSVAIDRLADALEKRPCAMVQTGRAQLVLSPEPGAAARPGNPDPHPRP